MIFNVTYGMRNPLYDMILEKRLTRLPLLGHPVSFTPVEYIAEIIIQAENKLSKGDTDVVGKSFKVSSYQSTIDEFHMIPVWDLELKHLPLMVS